MYEIKDLIDLANMFGPDYIKKYDSRLANNITEAKDIGLRAYQDKYPRSVQLVGALEYGFTKEQDKKAAERFQNEQVVLGGRKKRRTRKPKKRNKKSKKHNKKRSYKKRSYKKNKVDIRI